MRRSLVTLKALTYAPTGGIVAAATTSLPEQIGGPRNWDYRYCWLRDAAFTLQALLGAGYTAEARAWRDWLLRAVAGDPGRPPDHVRADRRAPAAGVRARLAARATRARAPVRIGNAAAEQFQLDVYGEVLDGLHLARAAGLPTDADALEPAARLHELPRDGLAAAGQRRCGRSAARGSSSCTPRSWPGSASTGRSRRRSAPGWTAPLDRWRAARDADPPRGLRARATTPIAAPSPSSTARRAWTPRCCSSRASASCRRTTRGSAAPSTPSGTELGQDGFVLRYRTDATDDGRRRAARPRGRVPRLQLLAGRRARAAPAARTRPRELFERLLDLRNDVGLLSEEYDPHARRQLGNTPQAFSHVGLVNTAMALEGDTAHTRTDLPASTSPDAGEQGR